MTGARLLGSSSTLFPGAEQQRTGPKAEQLGLSTVLQCRMPRVPISGFTCYATILPPLCSLPSALVEDHVYIYLVSFSSTKTSTVSWFCLSYILRNTLCSNSIISNMSYLFISIDYFIQSFLNILRLPVETKYFIIKLLSFVVHTEAVHKRHNWI